MPFIRCNDVVGTFGYVYTLHGSFLNVHWNIRPCLICCNMHLVTFHPCLVPSCMSVSLSQCHLRQSCFYLLQCPCVTTLFLDIFVFRQVFGSRVFHVWKSKWQDRCVLFWSGTTRAHYWTAAHWHYETQRPRKPSPLGMFVIAALQTEPDVEDFVIHLLSSAPCMIYQCCCWLMLPIYC